MTYFEVFFLAIAGRYDQNPQGIVSKLFLCVND